MSDLDPEGERGAPSEDEGNENPIGGTVECHGKTWKRVVGIANDARGDYPHARMTMKKMVANSHTKRPDFFYELFPVPLMSVLAVDNDWAHCVYYGEKGETKDGWFRTEMLKEGS